VKIAGAVALVTGGASGIGEGVVRMIHSAGGSVVIADLPGSAGERIAAELGPSAAFAPMDVTAPEQVRQAVDDAVALFGRLDILVNAAGITASARVVARDGTLYPLDLFRKGIEVNLIGAFDALRNAAGAMAKNEPGADEERGIIVNISSIAAYEGQVGQASYSASKGGLVALTLPLARDLALQGIRVMTICPGSIDTPMLQRESQALRDSLAQANVFPHRLGAASDISAVIRTCIETTYLNGEVIRVDAAVRLAPR
jgi:3-hydroxyacyl-CoA dehydrogenase / 3-hydroxy-2-methylbutyryl-CoA dehydrogenase